MLAFTTVASGRVLIIEQEEWEATLLAKFLSEAGFEVHVAGEARAGFDKVRELQPDCILCSVNLPDIDGFWVARRVRTEPTRVATTPFLFLTDADDTESRLQGLNVGADLYLTKPFRNEEVVAQVGALIDMANRLRKQRDKLSSDGPASSAVGAAFTGDVAQMSVATVLTLLELERRSGRLKVSGEAGKVALLELADGKFASGTLDGKPWASTELLREVLRWKKGSFSFRGSQGGTASDSGEQQKIGGLLLEAMRLEDESRR
ncbi:MAG: Response regulator receiver:Transcriptional regulatory protein C-terminal [Polyangiaceae bacterium]|jgi:DNA-binding response OmpR family regulator|nr:Response regulator receiver:Transcriptional regulatory protein C-terminal [Polyangiaceae bacterium]